MQKHKFIDGTTLPTAYGEFRLLAYDSGIKDFPHIALHKNLDTLQKSNQPVNVRLHSECLTGDIFSSRKCDCGEQLDFSLKYISEHGGVVLYLRQEGRGIGLINKIKAYNLQAQGMDTVQANLALGHGADERDYNQSIEILSHLKVTKINLLTNNPEKINCFSGSNIEVVNRIPVEVVPHKENQRYFDTKKHLMGHLFS